MLSLFKYPGQTAPVKIGPVNERVRPAKPTKREKGKGRRGERTHDGKIPVAREGRRERKDEEREGKGERERRERGERGEEEREKRGERERERERNRGDREASFL